MIAHYDWAGGREAMLRFGPAEGPVVVAALPLFEEANRTRAFTVTILRALAARGIAGALPDLPGTGESPVATDAVDLVQLQTAYQVVVDQFRPRPCYGIGIRSGALIDEPATLYGRWHLSPQVGSDLMRELGRIAGLRNDPGWWCLEDVVEIAGNRASSELLSGLMTARPQVGRLGTPYRVVRYGTDPKEADRKVEGAPLWRRAEPDNDPALAEILADDIAQWVRSCES